MLAAASISHSGAIASIKPAILKEAVCFLLVAQILLTQIGDFISAPPHSSYISKERRRRADGGGWVLASGDRAMRTSAFRGSVRPTGRILVFVDAPHPVFFRFAKRLPLASSSKELADNFPQPGRIEIETRRPAHRRAFLYGQRLRICRVPIPKMGRIN